MAGRRRGPLPAPFHRLPVARAQGFAHHHARRQHLPVGQRRPQDPRRDVGAVVRERRLRPARADRRCDEAADRTAVLQRLLPDRDPAGDRVGRAAGRSLAAAVPACLLLRLGLGGQRHGRAHGAALLGHPRPARAPGDHQPDQRLPRLDDGRRLARRHERHARPGRPADPRHRAHRAAALVAARPAGGAGPRGLRPAGRAVARGQDPRSRPGQGRRLHRRAGAGRRRRDRAAGQLLARGAAHLRQVRHPARQRRGDLRLRPHRPLVRLRDDGHCRSAG